MIKIIKSFFVFFALIFIAASATSAYLVDSATIPNNQFSIGTWYSPPEIIINEVYYDVDIPGGQAEWQNEWVEIYNNSSSQVNLKNWKISDAAGPDRVFLNDFIIPSKSFALITNNSSTWSFWPSIPTLTPKYELNANIGSGLNQTSDSVILKDDLGNIISQMSYSSGSDKHSWERSPAVSGNFILNNIPSPGLGI